MFNMCQLLVLKNELHLTALNIKTSLDSSIVLPWQVMCISCLLFGVRWGAASTWSMPTTKRAFLQCNKVLVSVIRDVHVQNSITFSTNSTQQSWPDESYSVKKFQDRFWVLCRGVWRTCADVSEEPVTSINRVEMDTAGSSETLE